MVLCDLHSGGRAHIRSTGVDDSSFPEIGAEKNRGKRGQTKVRREFGPRKSTAPNTLRNRNATEAYPQTLEAGANEDV